MASSLNEGPFGVRLKGCRAVLGTQKGTLPKEFGAWASGISRGHERGPKNTQKQKSYSFLFPEMTVV